MSRPRLALPFTASLLTLAGCSSSPTDKATTRPPTAAAPASAAAPAALRYPPTDAVRRAAVADYAGQQPGSTPATAAKFAAMFGPGGQGDYGPLYTRLLAGSGLRDDDVADAFAAYTVVTYQVAHGEAATLPAGPTAAVRGQFAPLATKLLAGQPAGTVAQLGEELKLQAALVLVGAQQPSPQFRQNVARKFLELYQLDVNALTLTDKGLVGANGAVVAPGAGPASAARPAAPAAPAAPTDGAGVAAGAQWFFRSRATGAGGITFEPVALLPDGRYCDVGEQPLESLDAAADQARRPRSWGTWRKRGDTFELGPAGKAISYRLGDGSWFPAYPAGAVPLQRTYQNSSGGSVGVATSFVISKINFVDDTHFTEGADGGVVTPNAAGGSRRRAQGTYQLQGHTLTLTYANGRTVRQSFAIGASGNPPHPSATLVFIGGDAYTDE